MRPMERVGCAGVNVALIKTKSVRTFGFSGHSRKLLQEDNNWGVEVDVEADVPESEGLSARGPFTFSLLAFTSNLLAQTKAQRVKGSTSWLSNPGRQ